jgi:tetratricopeptide (TPR) repeat protein
MKLHVFLAAVTLLAAPAVALDCRQADWQRMHDRAVSGDKEAVVELIGDLEQLLKSEPSNQLARVYLGSAYTLRSRDLAFGPKKLEALRHGGRLMDSAVTAAPGDPRVRLIRAVNSQQLPAVFNRRVTALRDFDLLVAFLDAGRTDLTMSERQAVYYFAGISFQQYGDMQRAAEVWKKAIELRPDSVLARKIRQELAVL